MLREMLSFYFESDKRKRYWHPINASETSKHAGLHLTFCSSVQSQRRPSRPAHLGVPDTEPSHPPPGPWYLPQAKFGSDLIHHLGFWVFKELQAVLGTNLSGN